MATISMPVGRGTASAIDPSLTELLQESIGVVYRPGDPAARKHPGRTLANSTPLSSAAVQDIMFLDMGSNRLVAYTEDDLYISSPATISFSSLWQLPTSGLGIDGVTLFNKAYITSGSQSDETAPFGALAVDNGDAYRLGLATLFTPPSTALLGGGALTGTYRYWTTEYDSTHAVESSFTYTVPGISPVGQNVRVTKPATWNASADKWRIYRTIDGGTPPIGWLVAEVAIATTTYDDSTTDANLVLNEPYRIVTINGIPESMDEDPQTLALGSITTFEGSLVATTVHDGDLAYTPAGEPHSWPASYRITFPSIYGGRSRCVRKCGDAMYGATDHETFRINYLPDETDNVFSTDIAVEHVANFGTPSPLGMCAFTAWGGAPVLFVASLQGPIIISGKVVDRAVRNIDWATLVPRSLLLFCKVIDNPEQWRVEMYYRDDTTDATSWQCLHFYYDSDRAVSGGPLPDMAWTGPHPVPGPGCYATASSIPKVFTASRTATGSVYLEGQGTTDAALLTDASGTIPFRLRTARKYPIGLDGEVRADRVFIHKTGNSSPQAYTVTFNSYRENGTHTGYGPETIPGSQDGNGSVGVNVACVSFDVRVVADGVTAMAPINNITVRYEEPKRSFKTEVT